MCVICVARVCARSCHTNAAYPCSVPPVKKCPNSIAKLFCSCTQCAAQEGRQKRDRSLFFCFGHLLVTILSPFLMFLVTFLPIPFCSRAMYIYGVSHNSRAICCKWGIALMCLCETKYQGGYRTIFREEQTRLFLNHVFA